MSEIGAIVIETFESLDKIPKTAIRGEVATAMRNFSLSAKKGKFMDLDLASSKIAEALGKKKGAIRISIKRYLGDAGKKEWIPVKDNPNAYQKL